MISVLSVVIIIIVVVIIVIIIVVIIRPTLLFLLRLIELTLKLLSDRQNEILHTKSTAALPP